MTDQVITFKYHNKTFNLHIDHDYAYGYPMSVYCEGVRYDWTSRKPTVEEALTEFLTNADFHDFLVNPRDHLLRTIALHGSVSPAAPIELATGGTP